MGRISNLTTTRFNNPQYSLNLEANKDSINVFVFRQILDRILYVKGISVSKVNILTNSVWSLIKVEVFYKTSKLSKYKYRTKNFLVAKKFNKYLSKTILYQTSHLTRFCFINLNNFLLKPHLEESYFLFQKFSNILFVRRQSLFVDFIKITALIFVGKVSTALYLKYIGAVFQYLSKKLHGRFLFFVKTLLEFLISNNVLKGARFQIGGRLLGKQRADVSKVLVGSVPLHELNQKITFSKIHVYTLYGAFGLKLWFNKF